MCLAKRRISLIALLAVLLLAISAIVVGPATRSLGHAQSPTPNVYAQNFAPFPYGSFPAGASAGVVEGVEAGVGGCGYSVSSIEQTTVDLINYHIPTFTEISVYGPCDYSVSDWENVLAQIVSYVEPHANYPGTYWGGIMLDEESAWGMTPSELEEINSYTANLMANYTTGITWWQSELFSGAGDWNQSTFNAIIDNSDPAPEIASSYMVSLTNGFNPYEYWANCFDNGGSC